MVGFTKMPNMPGVSKEMDALKEELQKIEDLVRSNLEALASELIPLLETELTDLIAKTRVMIPALPSLPAINLQAEITSLVALSPGSGEYAAQLASITTSFGSAISAGGYDLDSIVSKGSTALAGATGSLAAAIPNMELPSGATEAIELAKASLLPDTDSLGEKISSFSTDESVDELKGIFGDALAKKTLDESVEALASAADTATNTFTSRAERLAKELKEVQIQKRLDEVIAT